MFDVFLLFWIDDFEVGFVLMVLLLDFEIFGEVYIFYLVNV